MGRCHLVPYRRLLRMRALLPALVLALLPGFTGHLAFGQTCASNPIVCENQLPGADPSTWQIAGSGDSSIQGFATDISVNVGGTINFKVNTNARAYTVDIFRMGYYQGNGARHIAQLLPSATLPQAQPACLTDSSTFLYDCGNWAVSASWTVPSTAVSGLYIGLLTRPDTGAVSQMFFVVRNDASQSAVLLQTSDETWDAYNDYGGHSIYGTTSFDLSNRAYKVSYNRPFNTRTFEAATFLFNAEYPMIRWLEANGYDLSYFTSVDAARNGSLIKNHKIYISSGHDEYWSAQKRASVEAARDAGVNMAFFSGNEVFWKTRWENSIDGSNTPYRTLVCYKETLIGDPGGGIFDPQDPPTWTGTWRDPRYSPPADGGHPENALTGTLFMVNGPGTDNNNLSIQVPSTYSKMRLWRNTSIASLAAGQTATLPAGTLGYEWDADPDNGYRPAGNFDLSSATYKLTTDYLLDYGGNYGAGTATHSLTLHRAPSGALVFGAGTVQWAWGLDANHDGSGGNPSRDMQQATVNLLADMGVQPGTLQSGLVAATVSTDKTAPTSVITSPTSGSTIQQGVSITITGTAADSGGGVVGGVEISTDGGQSWHPASGRESWSYVWSPPSSGAINLLSRAVDDSANLETPGAGVTITVPKPAISIDAQISGATSSNVSTVSTPSFSTKSTNELLLAFVATDYLGGSNTTVTGVAGAGLSWALVARSNVQSGTSEIWRAFAPSTLSGAQVTATLSQAVDSSITVMSFSGVNTSGTNGSGAIGAVKTANSASGAPIASLVTTANESWVFGVGNDYDNAESRVPGTSQTIVSQDLSSTGDTYWVQMQNGPTPGGSTVTINDTAPTTDRYNLALVEVLPVTTMGATYSIAGSVTPAASGSGTTLTLSGAGSGSTNADASGNFTFSSLANGTYTITPSKSGYTFAPTSQSVTVSGANVTGISFTATAIPTYSISGNVSPSASGSGAMLSLSGGATASTTADSSGNFTFSGLANGSYTVTPSKTGFTFTPTSQPVSISNASVSGVNFTIQTSSGGGTIAVDANTSTDGASASTTIASKAFATSAANELLLAFVETDYLSGANTQVNSIAGAGLTWVLVKRTNTQSGSAEIWRAFSAAPLTGAVATATLSSKVIASMTVMTFTGVDPSGTNGSGAIGATQGTSAKTGAPSASLVTTRNNSLVVGVGNDFDNAISRTPGSGQTLVHQDLTSTGDTYWVQMRTAATATSGTTVTINDTAPTGDRYNLSICEILAHP